MLRARVRQSSSRLARERALEGVQVASIRLASLLRLPDVELMPAEAVPVKLALVEGSPVEWMERAMIARPEIRRARAEVEAAATDEDAAVYGPLIPEVQVGVGGGVLGPTLSRSDDTLDTAMMLGWMFGPGGLFDAGRRELASARLGMAEIELARVSQRAVDDVRTAIAQRSSREGQLEIAEQAVKDAEEALRLNLERREAGAGLPLEVLEAEEALARARQDAFVAVTEYNQAQLRLLIHSGGAIQK